MRNKKSIGVGIIGLGKVSPAHIEGYHQLQSRARVVAVCDSDKDLARAIGSRLGAAAFTQHEGLLSHPDVDAVVILLPHLLHHSVALAALNAGKHVTVEKPMAVSFEQCDELIQVARTRGLLLSVSENSRFVESYIEAKRLIDEGWIGDTRLVRAFIYGSALQELTDSSAIWKREPFGFAAILDAAPHFFYVLKWMFGPVKSMQAVRRYWARVHAVPDCDAEDGAVISGLLVAGGHFSIEIALNVELPWGERLEIYGSSGTVICDQLANPPVRLHRNVEDYGTPLSTVQPDPVNWRNASIHRGAANFVEAILDGREPAVTASDAAYAVRLTEVAYSSVHGGGISVEVV